MIIRVDRIKGLTPLAPGIHRVITEIPRDAKAGDTVVLLHVADGQKAKHLKSGLIGNRIHAEFEVTNQESS